MKVLVPLPIDLSVMANGRTLRIVHLLREMNHRCDLTCLVPGDIRAEAARTALPNIRVESPDAAATHASDGWPADVLPLQGIDRRVLGFIGIDEPLLRATAERVGRFDAVFGFDIVSVACLLAARFARRGERPRIVADMIDDPWITWRSQTLPACLRPRGLKQAFVVRRFRSCLIPQLDACTAVAPRDGEQLSSATGLKVPVVPNGVVLPDAGCLDSSRENLVVFTGAMQFPPNAVAARWLVRRVWPLVLKAMADGQEARSGSHPRAQLAIVGTSPGPEVRSLARAPGVVVTGAVDNVTDWLKRARVAVAPMTTGSGIKNKVLEASAAACPMVSTALGVAGLPCGENNGSLLADRPAEFADKVVTLLQNPALARTIGLAGRAMVCRQYSWPRMAERMLQVLRGPAPVAAPPAAPEDDRDHPRNGKEALTYAAS
ncbi:MAG TPA: glycosyltransferase family 4 protein [Phycisphaerae bacterium]|nr:glycosyltransferase family 4 protein [Phycisphaerae bacterium]